MSSSDRQPATRREQVMDWFKQRQAAGIHWLLLLAAVAFTTVAYDAWFLGVVALAWHHIVPTIKWYYSVGTGTKRNASWMFSRFAIFAITAGVFTWLCISEGFAIAVILPVLIGISIPLYKKRDWTMLGAIWLGVFMFAEFSNGASLAAAVILFAVINYERKKTRKANTFDEVELPERPAQEPRPYQDKFPVDRTQFAGPYADQHVPYADYPAPQHQPYPGDRRETGQWHPDTRYDGPRTGRYAAPQSQPYQGDGREEEWYPGADYDLRDPRRRPTGTARVPFREEGDQGYPERDIPTGAFQVPPGAFADPSGKDLTGQHTTQVAWPTEPGQPQRRTDDGHDVPPPLPSDGGTDGQQRQD